MEFLTEEQLDHYLCEPSDDLVRDLSAFGGDFMVIGAGGKVGPTVSAMLKRAVRKSGKSVNVYAVSRFQDPYVVKLLEREGVTMISADLSDPVQVAALPKASNIIYLLGRKFGTSGSAYETWHTNVTVPALITRNFPGANYVVFSSGNIYPFVTVESGGCTEETEPAPVGEYAQTCLGRERVFEYAARHYNAKVLLLRLNYAVDLRYGILYDLARKILNEESVPLNTACFNCVSQRYVSEVAIRAMKLANSEVNILNITGPEIVSTRETALKLAEALGKDVSFTGEPCDKSLLNNAARCFSLFGKPDLLVEDLIPLQARWLLKGGRTLEKPTHFEEREGKF